MIWWAACYTAGMSRSVFLNPSDPHRIFYFAPKFHDQVEYVSKELLSHALLEIARLREKVEGAEAEKERALKIHHRPYEKG